MQTERPRFREDLVAELIEDGGARFIDVADPDSGHMFRFFEVEYSLACAMDGERDVHGIAKWAEEELGLKASANEIRTVISTLGSLGYLDSGKAAAAAATDHGAAAVAAAPVETPRPAEPPARPTPPSNKATPPKGVAKTKTPASGVKKQPESEKESFNRWDQPTAMGESDDYLDKGVVAGNKRPHTPVPDVELGNAGGRVAARGDDLPRSDDMELGAPGSSSPAAKSTGKSSDMQLGNAGAANVSTDLAADMAISPADVKAAVRASQVMKAADVPPELAAELEPAKPVAKQPEAKPAKQPEAKPVAKQPEAKPVEKAPEKKPIQLPTERPVLPQAPPAPGPNKALLAVLVLVILGAIGFAVWKFVLNKKDTTASTEKQPPPPPPQPTPPPPPPVETAKLAAETSPPEEIKPAAAVQLATIIATDSDVNEGDTIAKLVGFKPSGDKVAMYEKELGILKKQLADAETARDAAATDAAKKPHETKIIGLNKMIPDREAKLAAAKTELEKFLIKSPGAGKVTTVAKANAKVTPTDIVATLQRAPLMVATFKVAPDATSDAKVLLAVKGSDQKLSCEVAATGGDGTKIACPADSAPEGTEVTYAGVDTSTPTDDSVAPTEGSADGSADGSAAPAEGSAAAPEEKKAPAPKAQPRRPAPKAAAPKAPVTEEKAPPEKLFPPASSTPPAEPAPAPATP